MKKKNLIIIFLDFAINMINSGKRILNFQVV